jgi:hypothetical protein
VKTWNQTHQHTKFEKKKQARDLLKLKQEFWCLKVLMADQKGKEMWMCYDVVGSYKLICI